jgi:hypothetical protein
MGDTYEAALVQNHHGRKYLIAMTCGLTFHQPESLQSWVELVEK